jgi:hypothetical protein
METIIKVKEEVGSMSTSSVKQDATGTPNPKIPECAIVCPYCGAIVVPIERGKIRDLRIIYYPCCGIQDGIW